MPSGAISVTHTAPQGYTSGSRASSVATISAALVADSTARSISAAVASAWNCRSSRAAMALNDAPSSSNSSRLLMETRLPKSRSAMRRVPSCSSRSGIRLRRMRCTLSSSTSPVDTSTITNRVFANRTTGPRTSFFEWLSVRLHVGAEKTSSSRIGQREETYGWRSSRARESASGRASRPSVWKEEWTPATELMRTWPLSSVTVRIVPEAIRL